ncbi:MAG: hypothetical protein AAGF32_01710 [Pseudomonadota bacterium]
MTRIATLCFAALASAGFAVTANAAPAAGPIKTLNSVTGGQAGGVELVQRRFRRRCVAVARTRGGRGRAIRSTRRAANGRRACRRAFRRCDRALARRQANGRNPFARCVVRAVRGGGHRRRGGEVILRF